MLFFKIENEEKQNRRKNTVIQIVILNMDKIAAHTNTTGISNSV